MCVCVRVRVCVCVCLSTETTHLNVFVICKRSFGEDEESSLPALSLQKQAVTKSVKHCT